MKYKIRNRFYYAAIWNNTNGDGISKKIASQIRAFEKLGETHNTVINSTQMHKQLTTVIKFLLSQLDGNNVHFKIAYFRNVNGWRFLLLYILAFFVKAKDKILEIPTWPFSGEYESKLTKFRLYIQSAMASKIFTKIVYMGEEEQQIWGLNAIRLDNCVPDESIWEYALESKSNRNQYHLICVASHAPWHAYERLLAESQKFKRLNIYVHVVGNCENLRSQYPTELNENIIYHGILNAEQLHELYLNMDCGIDSLGRHRSKNRTNSSLKSKEYLAFGLPVILSHIDAALEAKDFVMKVPSDETPLDLQTILSLIDQFRDEKLTIRNFAFKKFRWEIAFNRLIN